MTIQRAREILGKRAGKFSDKDIDKILHSLVVLSNKAIDQDIENKHVSAE